MKEFKYKVRQNPYCDSIRTVKCAYGEVEVEKTFYGTIPFQFFFIKRWVKKMKKMLVELDKL